MSSSFTSVNGSSKKRPFDDLADSNTHPFASSRRDSDSFNTVKSTQPVPNRQTEKPPSYIVGIDFGTTMTSVSYYRIRSTPQPPAALRDEIKFVSHWPGAGIHQNRGEVPSEMVYLDGQMHWGYNARKRLQTYQRHNRPFNGGAKLIQFPKILLGNDELRLTEPEPIRIQEVRRILTSLGKSVRVVVMDYMKAVLWFAKSYMAQQEDFMGFENVEFSISVPAGWPMEASWKLQTIIEGAVKTLEFGRLSGIFIINEPEAASAFSLDIMKEVSKIGRGETFLVCDAGGGTVDVTTYRVSQKSPFRLVEMATPSGGNYGSTYVNQAMESYMRKHLEPELSDPRRTAQVERRLSSLFHSFENETKRNFVMEDDPEEFEYFDFEDLKPNVVRGFGQDMIKLSKERIAGWFEKSLDGISDLIHRQLLICRAKGILNIQKVLFFGGYSQSKHFQNFMQLEFPTLRLIYPNDSNFESIVARGTVYRAIDKSNGPKRIILANIGILQTEEYNRNLSAHRALKSSFTAHPQNRRLYIYNTVDWIIHKGRVVEWERYSTRRNHEVIREGDPWLIKQDVYYNDRLEKVESHYPDVDERNTGSKYLGGLEVDLTGLKDKYGAALREDEEGGKYYEVHYNLLMELQGRNLKLSIEYPPGTEVRGSTQLILAACFAPGTD